jgi:hypothetical protein
MRQEEVRRHLEQLSQGYEDAKVRTSALLGQMEDGNLWREVDRARKAETDALRLVIVGQLLSGFMDDPDALAAWMVECVQRGEILEQRAEDDW